MPRRSDPKAIFSMRIDRDKLDRLRKIAERQNRSLVGHFRQLVDDALAAEDERETVERAA